MNTLAISATYPDSQAQNENSGPGAAPQVSQDFAVASESAPCPGGREAQEEEMGTSRPTLNRILTHEGSPGCGPDLLIPETKPRHPRDWPAPDRGSFPGSRVRNDDLEHCWAPTTRLCPKSARRGRL